MAGLIKNPDGSYSVTNATIVNLQEDLQAALGPLVTVVGRGVVGSTLPDLIAGTGSSQNFVQYLTTDTSRIVIENMGINDDSKDTDDGFRQAIEQFVDQVRQAGKVPVLEEPNPLCDPSQPPAQNVEWLDSKGRTLAAFVWIVNDVAKQKGVEVIHQYSLIKALPNWCAMMSDGWGHPGVALYSIKAQNQAAALIPIINGLTH